MILLFVESRLRFKNLPFNLILELFKSSIKKTGTCLLKASNILLYYFVSIKSLLTTTLQYIVYRNENSTSCFHCILHVNSEIFDID